MESLGCKAVGLVILCVTRGWSGQELNPGPLDVRSSALPLSYQSATQAATLLPPWEMIVSDHLANHPCTTHIWGSQNQVLYGTTRRYHCNAWMVWPGVEPGTSGCALQCSTAELPVRYTGCYRASWHARSIPWKKRARESCKDAGPSQDKLSEGQESGCEEGFHKKDFNEAHYSTTMKRKPRRESSAIL